MNAQFAPSVGQIGCDAIHCDSSCIVAWATDCSITRGYQQINKPELGFASYGNESHVIGKADNHALSLGDGGVATLRFASPIVNGQGADFAVFENSFDDFFLELAFVEVSSDGEHFFRFPSVSLTQTNVQVETFGQVDATKIHHLAGKYRAYYGTPFDLDSLSDHSLLRKDSICYVRIVDVIGCVDEQYASYDSRENLINEPWPTPFYSSGFDLDAVAVMHDRKHASITEEKIALRVFPNPVSDFMQIDFDQVPEKFCVIRIYDYMGNLHRQIDTESRRLDIDFSTFERGVYLLVVNFEEYFFSQKVLKR